jgi:hypothetical protein
MKKLKDLSEHNSEASVIQYGFNNNNPISHGWCRYSSEHSGHKSIIIIIIIIK